MLLQFYASTSELKTIGQLHGCRKNTASRIIRKAELALDKTLRTHPLSKILWPSKYQQQQWANKITRKYPLILNRFGFVDGKNYRVKEPSEIDLQNAMYNGWLHSVLISGVLYFGVDGAIIWGSITVLIPGTMVI